MPNYQNGKIYMIESLEGDCKYYGSTVDTLSRRLAQHRTSIKVGKPISSQKVLKYSDARILLVELFPCNSKMELEAKEAIYIRNNDCVNKNIPQRPKKEYSTQYYQDNKEHLQQQIKQYKQDNKDVIKQYNQKNKEKIAEKMLKKCLCDCGKIYTYSHYNRHTRSKRHQFWQKTYDFIYE
jgi:hypothetical protein